MPSNSFSSCNLKLPSCKIKNKPDRQPVSGICSILILTLFLSLPPTISFADTLYLQALQRQAVTLKLAKKPQWHLLLHYQKNVINGFSSLVADKKFFFALCFFSQD